MKRLLLIVAILGIALCISPPVARGNDKDAGSVYFQPADANTPVMMDLACSQMQISYSFCTFEAGDCFVEPINHEGLEANSLVINMTPTQGEINDIFFQEYSNNRARLPASREQLTRGRIQSTSNGGQGY